MSIDVRIQDSKGSSNGVRVEKDGRMHVRDNGLPPFGDDLESRVYRDYFRDRFDGFDMRIDGATEIQDFTVKADQENDRYIKTISFVIADDGASLEDFGAINALTNGVQFLYEDESGVVIINEALKTNWDFVRLAGGNPPFGTGTSSFKAPNVEGKVDAYIPVLNLSETFGLPYGIRLKAGSSQKIIIRVRDNTSGVDSFNAIAYGFDRLKE